MSVLLRFIVLLASLGLAGCIVLPLDGEHIDDPALREIHAAMDRTIIQAFNDPDENWTSGWLGNMWVNFHEGEQRGLCYQWKYRIHAGVKDTVHRVGWELTGIVVNQGQNGEHHGVIVYDPTRVMPTQLLEASHDQPVYVLDAWRQGKPDIYHVSDWQQLPNKTIIPARLIAIQ